MNKLKRWSLGVDLEKGFYQRHDDNGAWVDYKEADDLIAQLQQRNSELEHERDVALTDASTLRGKLIKSNETLDWEFNRRVDAEEENAGLAAHVERLRKIIGSSSLSDDPHVMSALNATPPTNLNAIKREAWIKGFQFSNPIANGNNTEYMTIIRIANKKYPTTEGE